MSYDLIDCQEMNRLHPRTFQVPSADDIATVEVGHSVKLYFNPNERMWVDIHYIGLDGDGQYFEGTLANDPIVLTHLTYGQRIVFRPRHICCM